jgi:hypothetical protein
MRIVDNVVLQKGMVSWELSGSLLHKSRFEAATTRRQGAKSLRQRP